MLARALILKTSALSPVERMIRKSRLFRGLVRRFVAGDTLAEALKVCEEMADKGFFLSLDYLGENAGNKDESIAAKNVQIEMLQTLAKSPCAKVTNVSVKLTQCGLDQGDDFALKNYLEILETAQEVNNFVRVDMEGSPYTQRTIDLVLKAWEQHKNTGTVLQSYLYRTPEDVETMIKHQIRTRIVKGAYLEPATVAEQDKKKVDETYIQCAKRLLKHGFYPAIATHDEKIIRAIKAYVEEEKIDKSKFEFQMIYGIRRDLQDSLIKEGYNMRVYVPFGDHWYPYFTRRLAERPANIWFVMKSLIKG